MTPERFARTQAWIRERFAPDADWYLATMARACAAGLPSIDAGPETARLLQVLILAASARRVVEVGTLAGATTVLLARALSAGGRVITIERDAGHAAVARAVFIGAGVADRVELRETTGLAAIEALHAELGDGGVDLVFLDAQRSEYVPMLPTLRRLLRTGGVLAIDNALSAGRWLPDPAPAGSPRDTMEEVCDAVRADGAFVSTVVPVGNGLLLAVRAG